MGVATYNNFYPQVRYGWACTHLPYHTKSHDKKCLLKLILWLAISCWSTWRAAEMRMAYMNTGKLQWKFDVINYVCVDALTSWATIKDSLMPATVAIQLVVIILKSISFCSFFIIIPVLSV